MERHPKISFGLLISGNKTDCGTERAVRREEGERLAREYNVTFMETSAKSGQNVDLAFLAVARYENFNFISFQNSKKSNSKKQYLTFEKTFNYPLDYFQI